MPKDDVAELGPLSEAIQNLAVKLRKKKKKTAKRKGRGYTIFAFGQKEMKGLNKRSIESALLKMTRDLPEDLCYVVLGNVRETEKIIYALCRKHDLPVALVPSNFGKFGVNAEGLRNGLAMKFFKPSKILLAYSSAENMEEDGPVKPVARWAKHNGIAITKVGIKQKEEEK